MRLALAQINSVVGDIDGNAAPRRRMARARPATRTPTSSSSPSSSSPATRRRICCSGPASSRAARRRSTRSPGAAHGITALVGAPHLDADLYNACFVLADGEVRYVYRKRYLPNYGVFDEDRYFAPGDDLVLLRFGDVRVGPTICEDIWQPGPPATDLALAGAQLDREHLRVAVPRRQGPRARGDAARARARQLVLRRALQRGRRRRTS